ncbi:bile acid:sodium symporter, partial [Blastococcus sp. CCUG 61487]|uniref:bile acid:sodium symporter n=1 Tax=Blastococcus sp. CCUG 61487 TaxID=1840703 RepID=UPI00201D981F
MLSHTTLTKVVDRGSVYLVVYAAFSAGMVEHVWQGLQISRLLAVVGVSVGLLAVVLGVTAGAARLLRFDRA